MRKWNAMFVVTFGFNYCIFLYNMATSSYNWILSSENLKDSIKVAGTRFC